MSRLVRGEDIFALLRRYEDRLARLERAVIQDYVPEWITPTFVTNFGSLSGWPVGYSKGPGGLVTVRGLLTKSTAPVAFERAFTLPVGLRPVTNRTFAAYTSYGASRIQVNTDGGVHLGELPAGILAGFWWTVDGIIFWAEQ